MDYNEAMQMYGQIRNTKASEILADFQRSVVQYAAVRAKWHLMSYEERAAYNATRTAVHNTLISYCNALSREMQRLGEDATWRTNLGDDRKDIGDFACFINCYFGILSR